MPTPIVFIQQGAPAALSHLNCALLQARWWNPGCPIFVLGDDACREALAAPGIEFVPLRPAAGGTHLFRELYIHLSNNAPDYERFCFERWFQLRDFLVARGLDAVWHFDSDVMPYEDLATLAPDLEPLDFTLTRGSGHSSFFRTAALEKFCAFILDGYRQEPATGALRARHDSLKSAGAPGLISDMTFLRDFAGTGGLQSEDLGSKPGDHPRFDGNMLSPHSFQMDGPLKHLTWTNQQPHATQEADSGLVRFLALHFQGLSKSCMPAHLRPPPGPLPDWSLGAMALLLASLHRTSTTLHDQVKEHRRSARDSQRGAEQLRSAEKSRTKILRPLVKKLRAIQTSGWLRLGSALRFTRATRQLKEISAALEAIMHAPPPPSPPPQPDAPSSRRATPAARL